MNGAPLPIAAALDALCGAFFLLAALGIVATRQVIATLQLFVLQSLLLAAAAVVLAIALGAPHLFAVAGITVVTKILLIPWLLLRTIRSETYRTREVVQVFNIPSALLASALLIVLGYVVAASLAAASRTPLAAVNLPLGFATVFLGAFAIVARREAVPQILGLLTVENGVFFASIAIVPELPAFAELVAAVDVVIVALVAGLLTHRIHARLGTTAVGRLTSLREQ